MKEIGWAEINFDMEFDRGSDTVLRKTGNRGLAIVILVLTVPAVILPSFFTVMQMLKGTATGNPVGALIFLFAVLGWPVLWSVNQFFMSCKITVAERSLFLAFNSLFGKKEHEIPFKEYSSLKSGRIKSVSRLRYGSRGPGITGYYYFRLCHKKRLFSVDLYNFIQEPIADERALKYSEMFGVALEKG